MAIPKFEDLFNNVLEILLDEKAHKTSEIKDIVTDSLNLRNFELKQATSAGEPTIRNRIGWTISTLKKAGYIESQKRGYVNITDVGLREYKGNITMEDLIKIPEVKNWFDGNVKIKQIRTVTLSKADQDCQTYDDVIDFLSDKLTNERDCHFHYVKRPINLVGKTLVLFKYEGKLIGKGIFVDDIKQSETIQNVKYNGYYLVEKNSVEIFNQPVGLIELKKYVNDIKSLNRDQQIDIKYLDNINQMIEDFRRDVSVDGAYDFSAGIIRSYLDENNLDLSFNHNDDNLFSKFKEKFSPQKLKSLNGLEILNNIFPQKDNKSNLCYALEFSEDFKWLCGGIRGGSIFKFSLFKYSETNKWTVGSAKSNLKSISEEEAVKIATKIRDAIVEGAEYIENNDFDSIGDYVELGEKLNEFFKDSQKDCPISPKHTWIHKYYTIIFPEKFPIVHSDNMKKETLLKFRIKPEENYYANDGQLYKLAKKSGVSFYSLFDERIMRLFFESNSIWDSIKKGKLVDLKGSSEIRTCLETSGCDLKRNLIYFGAPGTGKSFNLNKDKDKLLENYENNYERVTFHPDYSYANFVGTYKPVPDDDKITYRYVPGPFMRILKKALAKPDEPYLLIIEEINRANVAAVFGDVFQLLDRDENHESEYPIEASEDMKTYISRDRIKLPSNLFIWATMNSADQGVFPMDTAFKRRWDFRYFSINNNEDLIENTHVIINGKPLRWNDLRKQINDELLTYKINEDKLIGPFFAFNEYHNKEIPLEIFKDIFKNKIIMYLFEDAARSNRNKLFSGINSNRNITYSEICDLIDDDKIFEIFSAQIQDAFIDDEE